MMKFTNATVATFIMGLQLIFSSSSRTDAFMIPNNNNYRNPMPTSINRNIQSKQIRYLLYSNEKQRIDTSLKSSSKFVNDGLFQWMQPYLDLFGFVEGNTVFYGPGVAVDESTFPSTTEQERLRKEAKDNMMNIGVGERERRREAGGIAFKIAIGYAIFSSLILDDGSIGGNLTRFAVALVCVLYMYKEFLLFEFWL